MLISNLFPLLITFSELGIDISTMPVIIVDKVTGSSEVLQESNQGNRIDGEFNFSFCIIIPNLDWRVGSELWYDGKVNIGLVPNFDTN